jgi:hypothetical protein
MKKTMLVLLCSSFFVIAGAQVQFGVKAGVNLSSLTISGVPAGDDISVSSMTNFSGGILASLPLFSSCFLQPEVLYSGQGATVTESGESSKLQYGYLNIPVLFKYEHSSGLFAETGPQIGFLLSAKETFNGQTEDTKSDTQSTDFSWAFGLGYKLSALPLGIDVRYNLGLTNLIKNSSGGSSVKNSVFQFGLFYLFGGN